MEPIISLLTNLRRGLAASEMSSALEELVTACRDTGQAGSMTIRIKIKPWKGDHLAMEIKDDWKITPPQPEAGSSLLYATANGGLSARDPRQPDLPFRAAVAHQPTVDVDPVTGNITN
jgi:hypothetical protein